MRTFIKQILRQHPCNSFPPTLWSNISLVTPYQLFLLFISVCVNKIVYISWPGIAGIFSMVHHKYMQYSHCIRSGGQKLDIVRHYANFVLCQISFLSWEGARRENFLPLVNTRWLETPSKIPDARYDEILKACPLHVLHEVCGGQVE